VITRSNNRQDIDAFLALESLPNVHWIYFDLPRWASFWKRGVRGLRTYYHCWQLGAYLKARRLHRNIRFDLAHHVTFGSYWMPIFLPLLPVPFVWGPVGGGESAPRVLRKALSVRGRIYESARDLGRKLCEMNPMVRLTARRSALALATTAETEQRLRALGCKNTSVLPAVGLPAAELQKLAAIPIPNGDTFRVVSLGRLLYWKGFDLGLRAFARFHSSCPNSEYWILGDGPERERLERLAKSLDIGDNVFFCGAISREEVLEKWADGHVLLFPSLHDSGGWVSLEAMAAGRPVICLDLGGPALQVTADTGIKIKPENPEQVVEDLARALTTLVTDRKRCVRMGEAGRRRVHEYFNWDKRGPLMTATYRSL
jgi:glycosyltransferase involved in cell wall biosynthesis